MQNLEQIRAAAAFKRAQTLDKTAVNKLPASILNNGLLATVAFCRKEKDGSKGEMKEALGITAEHLENQNLLSPGKGNLDGMIEDLASKDSFQLQNATAEALEFIGYLRRFAVKKTDQEGTK